MEFAEGGQVNDKDYMQKHGINVNKVLNCPLPCNRKCSTLIIYDPGSNSYGHALTVVTVGHSPLNSPQTMYTVQHVKHERITDGLKHM